MIQNLEELKEKVYRKGFPKEVEKDMVEKFSSGQTEFFSEHLTKIDNDEMGYRLHFRVDEKTNKGYLNSIDAALLHNADAPGQVREQNIPADWLITAAEAHRMLKHGPLVAVNKDLYDGEGQRYNTWLSFDVKAPKNEYDNYPVLSYHENYFKEKPFNVKQALGRLHVPVKELENPQKADGIEKALRKANLVKVTIMHEGQQQAGYLSVNPKYKTIDVYDASMNLIKKPQQKKELSAKDDSAVQQSASEEVKKKSTMTQKPQWQKKVSKGITP